MADGYRARNRWIHQLGGVETLRTAAIHAPGVQAVDALRVRIDEGLPTRESHDLAEAVRDGSCPVEWWTLSDPS